MDGIFKKWRYEAFERFSYAILNVRGRLRVDHGSLYRALKDGGNPEGNTIERILDYLGYEIRIVKPKKKGGRK